MLHSKGILPAIGGASGAAGTSAEDEEGVEDKNAGGGLNDLKSVLAEKERQLERSRQIQAEVQRRIAEAVQCRICMDKQIDAIFTACGHVVSCMECASRCDQCPMCRAAVTAINKIYLPTELRPSIVPVAVKGTEF